MRFCFVVDFKVDGNVVSKPALQIMLYDLLISS